MAKRWVVRYESEAHYETFAHEVVWARTEAEARKAFATMSRYVPCRRVVAIRQRDAGIGPDASAAPYVWQLGKGEIGPL